ncbi:MAG TPA: hypothetical protein VN682_10415 [Terriglobales bacterium]|nr:hypothetical protein [Terriglobales bacterium]
MNQHKPQLWLLTGFSFVVICWEAGRTWGWQLQISTDSLRIRRYFVWAEIPWREIIAVEANTNGRNQARVTLKLKSHTSWSVGKFGYPFAHALRDHLRQAIADQEDVV